MRRDPARPFWARLLRREPRPRGDHRVSGEPRASEASLRSALRSGRTVAWEWDLVTDRIIRSENAPELLGLPVESSARAGSEFEALVHPDDRERVRTAVRMAMETRAPVETEFRLVRPDGGVLWVVDEGKLDVDETGRPVRMSGIIRDITERRRVEERLSFVTDHAPVLIAQIDSWERYIFVNRHYAELHRVRSDEIMGKHVREVLGPELYAVMAPHLGTALREGREVTWETAVPRHGTHIQYRAAIDRDATGRVLGVLLVGTDITELKQAEAEREALLVRAEGARAEAEAASRSKDEFLAILSHELRTPLTAMLGWSRMLRTGRLRPDQVTAALEKIERNTEIQAQLINDLLDVSRIVAGKLDLDLRPVSLSVIVRAAAEAFTETASARGVSLGIAQDESGAFVLADAVRLQQVFTNLVSNALKFTPANGTVEVRITREGNTARVIVTDTGQGIDPAFLPHIFERFSQADRQVTRGHGGLGLGLAIVRHIVSHHGGEVRAESAGRDRGTRFTVELPVIERWEGADEDVQRQLPELEAAPTLTGLTVLVVDDHVDTLELLRTALRHHGADVRLATCLEEALHLLRTVDVHVLVSDVGMPHGDGYDLIEAVRGSDRTRALPALALTAYASASDRQRALSAGFQAHAAKPIDAAQLAAIVAMLAGRPGSLWKVWKASA